ncbi:dihydropteroate synthase [Gallibacterium anatis]|uniref:Dihydropteroate synthase n=2 Tax=Gallibacterium anatis TaxID=750 RepID=F4HBI9_GALAU|nr:dihydropteroate synthase [Gallibacterium anatis]AEC16346.1 dihydropteroate synthase [Gallibacterium anatis UMN179]KGQ55284.1 dihydropteroate synthase [Gallibacterium anatis str. Avicor]KGQ66083.1 dihydropteroate synthase [Gallibacterium anatis 7990]KGQ68350.1 dihydropteroate synthase [Gallibacterium anatis]MBP4133148.1 dihydropteroate synthase [Gallibacterium anatis]
MKLYSKNQRVLDLSQAQVMGILNVTPDSFSDSGKFFSLDKALYHAEEMLKQGASIIDVGGESTRSMAEEVTLQQELDRVIPVVEAIRQRFDCWISVDTSKAEVMKAAADAGMDLINDIRALTEENALQTAAELDLPVCLMHMQGQPKTMQANPEYQNVVEEVLAWLLQRAAICEQAGVRKENIILDIGFGYGKTLQHNYQLLNHLEQFVATGYPLLIGLSRKSMIGNLLQKDVNHRLVGSVAGALISVMKGAHIVRVHDVEATVDALKVWQATKAAI